MLQVILNAYCNVSPFSYYFCHVMSIRILIQRFRKAKLLKILWILDVHKILSSSIELCAIELRGCARRYKSNGNRLLQGSSEIILYSNNLWEVERPFCTELYTGEPNAMLFIFF